MNLRPDQLLVVVTARLEAIGVPYCVGGSFASGTYGRARTTYDLDILIAPQPQDITPLIAAFQNDFELNAAELVEAIEIAPSYQHAPAQRAIAKAYHKATQFRIDFFISSGRAFEQMQLQRRVRHIIASNPEAEADFASVEDIILAKLEWFRLGNYASAHQWTDVRAMLIVQQTIDMSYLHHWATILQVRDLLESAVAGLPPPHMRTNSDTIQHRMFDE